MEQVVFPLNDLVSLPGRRPKKVLMTADTMGGVWTYAVELARILAKHQVSVALATMGAPLLPMQYDQVANVPYVEVYESTFKLEWMQDPWKEVDLAGKWLLELEEAVRPDVVHLNGYSHGALPWRAPTLVAGHSCVLSWCLAVRGEAAPGMWSTYRKRVKKGLSAANLIAAPSKSMAAMLNQHYGPLDVRIIPNGRDPELFVPREKDALVLTVGRVWDEGKNIAALEDIAAGLDWPVYVAGDLHPPDGGGVEPENVCHLGVVPSNVLANWFGRASIYALPARYEPFGLSVLEAGLSGCALVLGDIPSLRENWEGSAVFVPPNDSQALRLAIQDLIEDPERREALGVCARARALLFTPERMASGYLGAYADLMAAAAFKN
jgi:glycogen(starch) synthase